MGREIKIVYDPLRCETHFIISDLEFAKMKINITERERVYLIILLRNQLTWQAEDLLKKLGPLTQAGEKEEDVER